MNEMKLVDKEKTERKYRHLLEWKEFSGIYGVSGFRSNEKHNDFQFNCTMLLTKLLIATSIEEMNLYF